MVLTSYVLSEIVFWNESKYREKWDVLKVVVSYLDHRLSANDPFPVRGLTPVESCVHGVQGLDPYSTPLRFAVADFSSYSYTTSLFC